MLKVLYDAANEAADAANTAAVSDSLFNDDDDEDESVLSRPIEMGRNRTFQNLVLGDVAIQSTITWANLLRKMKAEIYDIEYAQAPVITSTRRFDLNAPFSLIPDGFDHSKNKKRSLLIGCNYHGVHGAELKASHDDIRSMKVSWSQCFACVCVCVCVCLSLLLSNRGRHSCPARSVSASRRRCSLLLFLVLCYRKGLHCERSWIPRNKGPHDDLA